MHEDVGQVAPCLRAELRVVNQGVLQVSRMGYLQHELVQRHSVVEEKGNLHENPGWRGPVTRRKTALEPLWC